MNNKRKVVKETKWPKVSLIIAALNDEKRLQRCLDSVQEQDYPKYLIDLIIVDDGSTDGTVELAKKYGARVFINPGGYIYKNMMIGVKESRGKYFFTPETDIVLGGRDFIKNMIYPMLVDKRIVASFTDEKMSKDMHWSARFLCYATAQADPLLEFLFDKIENKIVNIRKNFFLCKFDNKLQPAVRMFYRKNYFQNTASWKSDSYFDHDFVINCVKKGYTYFAYVPDPGYFHYHVKSLRHLMQKRVRNIKQHFLPYYKKTKYVILNTRDKKQVFRLVLFVVYANLIFPAMVRGIYRYFKYKDWVLLSEPIITICVTDALLINFLKEKQGRKFIMDSLKSFIRN